MDNEERESIMRAGRNALFASLVISGVITIFVSVVFFGVVMPDQADSSMFMLPVIFNAVICYPLYRALVNKYLGID